MKQALILSEDRTKRWYKNDLLHREDGPAIEFASGTKFWYINGQRHRIDGPAIEYASGSNYWFFENKWIREVSCQEEFEQWLKYKVFL